MIVKETGSPSEPPLPQLIGGRGYSTPWENLAAFLRNEEIKSIAVASLAGIVIYTATQLVSHPGRKPFNALINATTGSLIFFIIASLIEWFKQRKENAA